ncbi:bactofilin family protein [Halobacterium rubrum]|uniref:bactofilin family protein n=1 Tax=Halobacterium TaxID=2239 RepID=UPI001F257570|nr:MULTISPECIES: polymer-forming cytoskeletal protein [Halobacterium]MDH5018877.1 polymer-forming cytoskeletal protein [Halobacterium rubrum]
MNRKQVRAVALAVVLVVSMPALVGVAAAEERFGGTVVVEEGETVSDDLQAVGGTVVVRGTVDGNLEAFAGSVVLAEGGTVTGTVQGAAGSVTIAGSVGEDVEIAGGSIDVAETATIAGDVDTGAGSFTLDGRVDGTVRVGAGSILLGSTASVGGDFLYDGDLSQSGGATVDGELRQDDSIASGGGFQSSGMQVASWLFTAYGVAVTLVFGVIVLALLPGVAAATVSDTREQPARTAGIGFLALFAGPALFAALLLTIVGIPLAFLWLLVYGLLVLVGFVLGEYAVGAWLLSLADYENRWVALLVGVLAVFALGEVPILGGLVEFVVLLLGLGALAAVLWRRIRGRRRTETAADAAASTGDQAGAADDGEPTA